VVLMNKRIGGRHGYAVVFMANELLAVPAI
jgi:hypothetical protein